MPLSIRWKLILLICGPLLIMSGALLAFDYARLRAAAVEQMEQIVADRARTSADQIDARLETVMQAAESVAASINPRNTPSDIQLRATAIANLRANILAAATAVVIEPPDSKPDSPATGGFIRRTPAGPRAGTIAELLPKGHAPPAWYTSARESKRPSWSPAFESAALGPGILYAYSVPILDADSFRGTVVGFIRADDIQSILIPGARRSVAPGAEIFERPRAQPAGGGNTGARAGAAKGQLQRRAEKNAERRAQPNPATPDPTPAPEPAQEVLPPTLESAAPVPNASDWKLSSPFGPDGFVVIDRDRTIVSSRNPEQIGKSWTASDRDGPDLASVLDHLWDDMRSESAGVTMVPRLSRMIRGISPDDAHWIAFATIKSTGWSFVTAIPQSLVIDPILAQLRERALFLVAGVLAVALFIAVLSTRISRPVERLATAVDRLAAGDLEARVDSVKGSDELARLANGFNAMTGKLRVQVQQLAREQAARGVIESELNVARQIQTDLLPQTFPPFPDRTDFALHAINVPARHVAGDFYDFFFVDAELNIVIADVSGKGVPAALLMAVTRTIIRNFASLGLPPAEIISRANRILVADSNAGMFVTMFLAQYHPGTGRLVYVNAGHPPPRCFRSAGEGKTNTFHPVTCCEATGSLLGVADESEIGKFEQREATLGRGETLLLYTDGITEAMDPAGKMLGDSGLDAALKRCEQGTGSDVKRLCESLVELVHRFENNQQHDDITILALRRT